jgi:pyruvate formate lyase activating enzyme
MRESKLSGVIEKLSKLVLKMEIKGIQKFTLLDYPKKIACTIFLFGCNFRCGFCHNPELVLKDTNPKISEEEILSFLEKRKGQLEGVCITGGEPLLTLDENFLKKIKDLGYLIKLDTNGSFPERIKDLVDKRLIDFIAMDIKNSKEKYLETISRDVDLNKIEESIKTIHSSGLPYDFRTTIVPGFHEKEDIVNLAKWLNDLLGKKPKKYSLQGFKNMGKFIDNKYQEETNVTELYLEEIKELIRSSFEKVEVRV